MTTEQFLSHLGIEVGKEFTCEYPNGFAIKMKIVSPYEILVFDIRKGFWVERTEDNLSDLLNCEITPLPKYTLTEDEKAIVRVIDSVYEAISVNVNGGIHIYMDWPPCSSDKGTYLPVSLGYFNFIDRDDLPVSLDDLRKCL